MIITFTTSVQVIYIGMSSPFEYMWMNRLELCNEYLILLSCTFLFAYSDGLLLMKNPGYPNPEFPEYDEALPDMDSKLYVGWFNIAVLGMLVVVNLVVMLTVQVHKIYEKIRIFCLK